MEPTREEPTEQHGTPGARQDSSAAARTAAVLTGALLLAWPAIYNRYPLLYPDSITYMADGRVVARALFLHEFSSYYGMRSLIYALGILPFHWDVTPWPVVALHALLAAYVIWLVVRTIFPQRSVTCYLLMLPTLSLLTSLSWFASLILPDLLGPLLYLSLYLLVFAWDALSLRERAAIAVIAYWAAASHITHLILASGLCLLFSLLWLVRWPPVQSRIRAVCGAAWIVIVAAASLLALHAYLYGQPSLNADSPPFLAARVIADGPGRWYLEQHCPQLQLALCESVGDLPDDSGDFLWKKGGIWPTAAEDGDERIRQQEFTFVLAVVRAYPREELLISAGHFWEQLRAFGLWDLDRNNWVLEAFDSALPGDKQNYLRSWQANDDLPLDAFSSLQYWTVVVSLAVIAVFVLFHWGGQPVPLLCLSLTIVPVVVANALVTGVLSNVEERYQARVVWLLPLLAAVFVLHWLDQRRLATSGATGLRTHPAQRQNLSMKETVLPPGAINVQR
jgi:hypothetical protein